jgi:hypothetical protein
MGKVRAITPLERTAPVLRQVSYAAATAYPIGLSRDLYQSVDDGTTWTLIHAFAEGVSGCVELADGEALVSTASGGTSAPGNLYKSTGWAANKATATWTKVLTTPDGFFPGYWSTHGWTFGNDNIVGGSAKYGVVCEYGTQTGSGAFTGKATKVYFSQDYGATWTVVLDLKDFFPGIFPLHCHSAAYDPWWDRLWVLYGDTQAGGTTTADVLYSDDHGATWQSIALSSEWTGVAFQSTALAILEDCIVIGSDNGPGFVRIARRGNRVMGPPQIVGVVYGGSASGMVAMGAHRNEGIPGAPLLMGFVTGSSATAAATPIIMVSPDGLTFAEAWRDDALAATASVGVYQPVGPTATGKVLARVKRAADTVLLVGELFPADADGLTGGTSSFTGDGTTTVFNIPHGLPAAPRRFTVEPATAAAAASFYRTADGTNLIVTFTAAPANAAALSFNWTAGL